MECIRKDCKFHKNDTVDYGCTALKKLYCRLEDKPCSFHKTRTEEDEQEPKKKRVRPIESGIYAHNDISMRLRRDLRRPQTGKGEKTC